MLIEHQASIFRVPMICIEKGGKDVWAMVIVAITIAWIANARSSMQRILSFEAFEFWLRVSTKESHDFGVIVVQFDGF